MEAVDAKRHLEDIANQLNMCLFHEQSLIREIELLRPKIESKIVRANTTRISQISDANTELDLAPITLADMETVQARKSFYYATIELANTKAEIIAKKEMYNTYKTHVQQQLTKESKPLSDEKIFDAFRKVQDLKTVLTESEIEAYDGIKDNLMKIINAGKEKRIELYETLQNIIKNHE
ncbi:MAG: hypothetical protein PHS93_09610 [Candidatus Omnitrophica bacterium]|nr:hypothetical protein [Candidatus Omnitrophota bacterium]